jgi:UPF0716 protein FxsA
MWVLVAFFGLTLVEIALFVVIGGWLTLWPTLALVVILPIIGTYLARLQGLGVMMNVGASLRSMRTPSVAIAHGPLILFAWVLFLIPGFFTDAVGFLLLVPAIRQWLIAEVSRRVTGNSSRNASEDAYNGPTQRRGGLIIDAEYHEVDPDHPKRPGQSRWTQD